MIKLLFTFFLLLTFFTNFIFAKSPLTIYYYERAPYHYTTEQGEAKGILIDITKKLLDNANIKYHFTSIPVKRIFTYLKKEEFSCSPGWFFTKERSKIFKYTLPIYESKPIVAIINAKKWKNHSTICSIDKLLKLNLTLGLISGFKYGKVIENKLREYKGIIKLKKITVSMDKIIMLTAIDRIDFTFVSKENIDFFLKNHKEFKKKIIVVKLPEIKKGEKRYIICSKKVPDQIIKKINKAILKLKDEK